MGGRGAVNRVGIGRNLEMEGSDLSAETEVDEPVLHRLIAHLETLAQAIDDGGFRDRSIVQQFFAPAMIWSRR